MIYNLWFSFFLTNYFTNVLITENWIKIHNLHLDLQKLGLKYKPRFLTEN